MTSNPSDISNKFRQLIFTLQAPPGLWREPRQDQRMTEDESLPAVGAYWIDEADYPAALKLFRLGAAVSPKKRVAAGAKLIAA